MSRSYKKSYAYITGCHSKKSWRSKYNRVFRHAENKVSDDETYVSHKNPFKFFYADVWAGPTDGKAFYCVPGDFFYHWAKKRFCPFKKHGHHLFHK